METMSNDTTYSPRKIAAASVATTLEEEGRGWEIGVPSGGGEKRKREGRRTCSQRKKEK